MASDDPIRASDADREVVVASLRDAYTAGRLDLDEFDERTSAAYESKTWGDLRQLTIDLPAQPILGGDVPGRPFASQLPPGQLPAHPPRDTMRLPDPAVRVVRDHVARPVGRRIRHPGDQLARVPGDHERAPAALTPPAASPALRAGR
jgi:hypothetical protein